MRIANSPINYQAITLEEAETEIRLTIQSEYVKNTPLPFISKKIREIIDKALKKIRIASLREAAKISLLNFYRRQYEEIRRIPRQNILVALGLARLLYEKKQPLESQKIALKQQGIEIVGNKVNYASVNRFGIPLQKFSNDYIKDNVKPVYDRMAKQFPLDPNDITGRNSLRNLAEMEVRYQGHLDNIEELRAAGHRLVMASVHADCSERCAKWQGRVYSLDGTSGTTSDGRKFVPLEEATDVFYTTKAGKTYKNGLLGFNCRHYLIPYKEGYRFPKPNAQEERKQYAITLKQRALEREVRKWRTEAVTLKQLDRKGYLEAKNKAEEWNKQYIEFSRANKRAYYPSRTKIL